MVPMIVSIAMLVLISGTAYTCAHLWPKWGWMTITALVLGVFGLLSLWIVMTSDPGIQSRKPRKPMNSEMEGFNSLEFRMSELKLNDFEMEVFKEGFLVPGLWAARACREKRQVALCKAQM